MHRNRSAEALETCEDAEPQSSYRSPCGFAEGEGHCEAEGLRRRVTVLRIAL